MVLAIVRSEWQLSQARQTNNDGNEPGKDGRCVDKLLGLCFAHRAPKKVRRGCPSRQFAKPKALFQPLRALEQARTGLDVTQLPPIETHGHQGTEYRQSENSRKRQDRIIQ
jgi:hypothetical protein